MGLIIDRDRTYLKEIQGKANLDDGVPEFLRNPRVVNQDNVRLMANREASDDLLIVNGEADNLNRDLSFFQELNPELLPAVWSGYRSALVYDEESEKWFRLKGIALNPQKPKLTEFEDGEFWIQGGQKRQNAEYERRMSDRFNEILRDEGIDPVMQYRGTWRYPKKIRGDRASASIVEVKGDTRLDELMTVLEAVALNRSHYKFRDLGNGGEEIRLGEQTTSGLDFEKLVSSFYEKIGYRVGRLKKLMDKSGQTWSCDSERSNAHIGNIVVYNEDDRLKVGFVDFDASCDNTELTKSELEDLRKREIETIYNSVYSNPISLRQIGGVLNKRSHAIVDLRENFFRGFQEGYFNESKNYTNEIIFENMENGGLGVLEWIFELLRGKEDFTKPLLKQVARGSLAKGNLARESIGRRSEGYVDSFDKVIRRNRKYQQELRNNILDISVYKKDSDDQRYLKGNREIEDDNGYHSFLSGYRLSLEDYLRDYNITGKYTSSDICRNV